MKVFACLIPEAGRKWYAKYYNSAVAIPSVEMDQLCEIARENNVYLSVGIIEKDGGTLYCTALLLGRDGAVLSRHRKVCNSYQLSVSFAILITGFLVDPHGS